MTTSQSSTGAKDAHRDTRKELAMRKIIYLVHASLDGHIEGPNGEFDWPVMGPELSAYSFGINDRVDTFLYGRLVWDMMSGFWPHAESMSNDEHDLKFAPIWRETPKVVFSTTLQKVDWNTRVISENIVEEVTALKQRPGKDLLLSGGSSLATTLTEAGLIDEYHVVVHPVVLGGGKRLFPESKERITMQLIESRILDSRTVLLRYHRSEQGR
jgi:dihydrofolate reductase